MPSNVAHSRGTVQRVDQQTDQSYGEAEHRNHHERMLIGQSRRDDRDDH